MPVEWWQENLIEGTVGVRAVTDVEEFKNAFLALLKASIALDLKLMEWKSHLKCPGAGAVTKVTYIHYCVVSMVKTRVPQDSVCTLNGKIT